MKASDWAAEHSPPGAPLDLDAAFDLFDEWAHTDTDGQAWAWRTAHADKYREDPITRARRVRLARIRREDAEAFAHVR